MPPLSPDDLRTVSATEPLDDLRLSCLPPLVIYLQILIIRVHATTTTTTTSRNVQANGFLTPDADWQLTCVLRPDASDTWLGTWLVGFRITNTNPVCHPTTIILLLGTPIIRAIKDASLTHQHQWESPTIIPPSLLSYLLLPAAAVEVHLIGGGIIRLNRQLGREISVIRVISNGS